ncbi:ScbA/BarX family gamma-butyrolactone biosynthesis protein [Streptomyces sp. TLI_55]|uniref:ScbA/BarX family gamma-butyrolactone biosynthesis protein n=1 Tax=Streptomyces sp. TLI_55 TaxID=1938861 RepID=UPI0027BB14EB|nr:ScbA/BarX family gamma-butyrolactone biosynthesis protein [Streptomyces sp. TLI_55]
MNRAIPSAAFRGSGSTASTEARALFYQSLTTTVPKELVHRASVAEVMLTDWERVSKDHFTVAAQWPRGHSFFANVDGRHDPLIAAETIRQAGTLLTHAEFGVPLGYHFLMWDLSVSVQPEILRVGTAPASVDVEMTCEDVKLRGNRLAGCRYNAVIRRDGQVAATGSANFTCTSGKVYERLRGDRSDFAERQLPLTAPVAPQNVGRISPMDVVLSPIGDPNRWLLRVDTRHPILFDHPVDHVPGMVLLEAARQASTALLGCPCLPVDFSSEFMKYVELDAPCVIEAQHLPDSGTDRGERVLVTGYQDETPVFRSTVTMAPFSA